MRYTLLESAARHERRAGGTMVSVLLHSGAIALAVVGTVRATPRSSHGPTQPPVIYTAPARPAPPAPTHGAARRNSSSSALDPSRFQPPVIPPVHIRSGLPPIDVTKAVTTEHLFDGAPVALTDASPGGGSSLGGPADGVWSAALVERPVMGRADNPRPRYPESLRAVHAEGVVVARFVVDSTGRVEPPSIVFSEATHPLFADAVRQALLASRYIPAEVGGQHVRQLVEQRFAFQLAR